MDSNEVWLDVEALDARGRTLARSGALDERGAVDPAAHLVRAQPVDGDGRRIDRRDVQHVHGVAWDNSLPSSDPVAVRYRLPDGTARVRARLLYRKLPADYLRAACAAMQDADAVTRTRCADVPVIEIASADEAVTPRSDLPRF